jgi:hypothetical protein
MEVLSDRFRRLHRTGWGMSARHTSRAASIYWGGAIPTRGRVIDAG